MKDMHGKFEVEVYLLTSSQVTGVGLEAVASWNAWHVSNPWIMGLLQWCRVIQLMPSKSYVNFGNISGLQDLHNLSLPCNVPSCSFGAIILHSSNASCLHIALLPTEISSFNLVTLSIIEASSPINWSFTSPLGPRRVKLCFSNLPELSVCVYECRFIAAILWEREQAGKITY